MECKKPKLKWKGHIVKDGDDYYASIKIKGNKNYKEIGKYSSRKKALEGIKSYVRKR